MYFCQFSISFVTFPFCCAEKRKGSSSDSSPNLNSIRRSRKENDSDEKGLTREKKDKRRSKSVGAFARIGTKPKIPGPKPKSKKKCLI